MKKIIKLFLIFSLCISALGVETITHSNCNMYEYKNPLSKSETSLFKDILKERGYFFKNIPKSQRLELNSFYFEFKKKKFGSGYKSCLIEIDIKTNSNPQINEKDETIHKKSSTRKFPRHTFSGSERCKMALQDLLFSLNFCKKGK